MNRKLRSLQTQGASIHFTEARTMKQIIAVSLLTLLLMFAPTQDLSAQLWDANEVGEDIASLALSAGVFSPRTDYADGSTYESGTAIAAALSLYPFRNVGVRLHASRAPTDGIRLGETPTPAEVQDPVQLLWGLEALIRYPMVGDSFSWFPYVAGGFGGKSYNWEVYEPARGGRFDNTVLAMTYGGGVEVRFGEGVFGVLAEVRGASSDYQWYGLDESQSDLMFTGGITISY